MARSLRSLVRLHDYEVDQKRRELAVLLAALDQIVDRSKRFEIQIVTEKKVAAAAPAIAGFQYGRYAQVVRRQNIWDRLGCKLVEGWPHLVG